MATISTLAVNLIARTSAFDRKMRKSRGSVKRFGGTAKSTALAVAGMARGLLLAAGVGGFGIMLKKTMENIDATAKLSDRIGVATEKLVGLRHAAQIMGVESSALDKSLEIFVRRMGEVKAGSGEAKKGLEALGLSAEEMINMTPDRALGIIADKIRDLGTQAEKSAAAYFLFGRSGAQLLNMFEEGSDGLAAMQREAESLGLTFNRIDAAKVEEANDAITRTKSAFSGLGNIIAIELAGPLETAAQIIKNMLTDIRGLKRDTATGLEGFQTPDAIAAKAKGIEGVEKAIASTKKLIEGFEKQQEAAKSMEVTLVAWAKVARGKDILEALEKRLAILKKTRKEQDAINKATAAEARLAARMAAEGANIFKALKEGSKDPEKDFEIDRGQSRFQTIRSEFIDVAALNPARTQVNELMKLNQKTDITNEQLAELNRNSLGRYQA